MTTIISKVGKLTESAIGKEGVQITIMRCNRNLFIHRILLRMKDFSFEAQRHRGTEAHGYMF